MKLKLVAAACCAAGVIAAPSWIWKEDSIDRYFRVDGSEIYYCQSGWEPVRENDKKYALLAGKGLTKRDRDHPEDDKKHKHKGKKCDDHG